MSHVTHVPHTSCMVATQLCWWARAPSVMSYIRMSRVTNHVAHTNSSRNKQVMSRMRLSHVTSHVAHTNESCQTCPTYLMNGSNTAVFVRTRNVAQLPCCATWLIHMCDMTHSYVRHDSFVCATPPIHVCKCETWLIHTCNTTHSRVYMWDMTHSYVQHHPFTCVYVRHDLFICATPPIHMCICETWVDPYIWIEMFTCVTWHIHMCDMTRFIYMNRVYMKRYIHMCDVAYLRVWRGIFTCVTWIDSYIWIEYIWIDVFSCVTWHFEGDCDIVIIPSKWDLTRFIYATWLIHMCDGTYVREHVKYLLAPLPCNMTHTHMEQDSFVCVMWLYCDTSPSYTRQNLFCHAIHSREKKITRLIRTCDKTHSWIWQNSFEKRKKCHTTHLYMRQNSSINVT